MLIREGSVSKDLHALAPLLTLATSPFLAFCTDDRNPLDVAEEGHLDGIVRMAIAAGVPPLAAYRSASLTAARAFGLFDRGMIAPGCRADIVLIDALESCGVSTVISAGRVVDDALFAARATIPPIGLDSMKARPVAPEDLVVPGKRMRDAGHRGRAGAHHHRTPEPRPAEPRRRMWEATPRRTWPRSASWSGTDGTATSAGAS